MAPRRPELDPNTPIPTPFRKGKARADYDELLRRILTEGILYRTDAQTVVSRDGTPARWMFESWPITMTAGGARLCARLLLKLLDDFDATQLATYGTTGIPILQSVLLEAARRGKRPYTGLIVRKERKGHGSRKLIEGTPNLDRPVVLIDDSVSSGLTSYDGTRKLEEAGLRVEGGVCLVRFGYKGGFSIMTGRGYRMATLYDVYEHVIRNLEGEKMPATNPTRLMAARVADARSEQRAAEGQHPAALAREVIAHYIRTGEKLRAPSKIDRAWDTHGGVWVSLRDQKNVHVRHAREGFWRFPEDTPPKGGKRKAAAADVVWAAHKTAVRLGRGDDATRKLADSGIAVTAFSALESVPPGLLDNDRYGIVVRSRERPQTMGGALPRMPGITDAWRQLQHARIKNGKLFDHEPFEVLRHDVDKVVEDGMAWQPTGVPKPAEPHFSEREDVGGALARRAWALCAELCGVLASGEPGEGGGLGPPIDGGALPPELHSVYVTVYRGGRTQGCVGGPLGERPDEMLERLCRGTLGDGRFGKAEAGALAVTVSLLWAPLTLGRFSCAEVMNRVRYGQQALMASSGQRQGLLLPFVAARADLGRVGFAQAVLRKAGVAEADPRLLWHRYESATWYCDEHERPRPLRGAFPVKPRAPRRDPDKLAAEMLELCGRYLIHHQRGDGDQFLHYQPLQNHLAHKPDLPRLAHAGWLVARAANEKGPSRRLQRTLREAARARAEHLLGRVHGRDEEPGTRPGAEQDGAWLAGVEVASVSEVAMAVLALSEARPKGARRAVRALCRTLWSSIDRHGRIDTHREPAPSPDAFQDYAPGQVLLALATAHARGWTSLEEVPLTRALRFYAHRALCKRNFGQVTFVPQAFAAWSESDVELDARTRARIEEATWSLGDWILEYQAPEGRGWVSGAFFNDHQPDTPGFTSALYVEGLLAGARLARAVGEKRRAERYRNSSARALRFLRTLVLDDAEAALLPNPALARGGCLPSAMGAQVRIDFSGHLLAAALAWLADGR